MAPRMFADMNVDELIEARQRLVARSDRTATFDVVEAIEAINFEIGRREQGQPTPTSGDRMLIDEEATRKSRDDAIERLEAQLKQWSTANAKLIAKLTEVERENVKLKAAATVDPVIPGERFAKAGNELIGGIMKIQFTVHRPVAEGEELRQLLVERHAIAEICEALVGPYKIIIADLSTEQ